MIESEFTAFTQSAPWQFAYTMPQDPHEYTLRRKNPDSLFVDAVEFIRRYGESRLFKGRPYIQYDENGWTYWTMGNPVVETILINRARCQT